jgi:hypothetical protein
LAVRGLRFSTVLFCDEIMHNYRDSRDVVIRLLETGSFGPISLETIALFFRTISGGRDGYGGREKQETMLLPQFAGFLRSLVHENPSREAHSIFKQLYDSIIETAHEFSKLNDEAENIERARFISAVGLTCRNRRLFVTTGGHLGLGPWQAQPGDILCVLGGADMPFIIRKEDSRFRLVGECYVDDIMNGEAVEAAKVGKAHHGPFILADILEGLFNFDEMPEVVPGIVERRQKRHIARSRS